MKKKAKKINYRKTLFDKYFGNNKVLRRNCNLHHRHWRKITTYKVSLTCSTPFGTPKRQGCVCVRSSFTMSFFFLLQNGVSPNFQFEDNLGPLHLAAKNGNTQCAFYLLQFNANPNMISKVCYS